MAFKHCGYVGPVSELKFVHTRGSGTPLLLSGIGSFLHCYIKTTGDDEKYDRKADFQWQLLRAVHIWEKLCLYFEQDSVKFKINTLRKFLTEEMVDPPAASSTIKDQHQGREAGAVTARSFILAIAMLLLK
jgi:hypothetical protein